MAFLQQSLSRLLLFLITLLSCIAFAEDDLRVISALPLGDDLSQVRQISIRFNLPISKFPYNKSAVDRLAANIEIAPLIDCNWLFISSDTLACNINKDLNQATTYNVTVFPSLTSDFGKSLSEPFRYSFTTTLPDLTFATTSRWSAPGSPVIFSVFNQKVSRQTIEQTVFFVDDNGKKYAVSAEPDYSRSPAFLRKKQYLSKGDSGKKPFYNEHVKEWSITPRDEMPRNTGFKLISGAGLESIEGPQKSIKEKEIISLTTFGDLKIIDARCITSDGVAKSLLEPPVNNNNCNPSMPIVVTFSTPVSLESLRNTFSINPFTKVNIGVNPVLGDGGVSIYEAQIVAQWKSSTEYLIELNSDNRFFLSRWFSKIVRIFNKNYKLKYILHDDFNQKINKLVKIKFRTGDLGPDIANPSKIIIDSNEKNHEVKIDTVNIKTLNYNFYLINNKNDLQKKIISIKIDEDIKNKTIDSNIPINDIFGDESGVAYGSISSFPRVARGAYLNDMFLERTPWEVRANIHESDASVILFNRSKAIPIKDAQIELIKWQTGEAKWQSLASGKTDENGVYIIDWKKIDNNDNLYILAKDSKDVALLPLDYRFMRHTSRIDQGFSADKLVAWGITNKPIYRTGETVGYKIYVRNKNMEENYDYKSLSYTLRAQDNLGNTFFEKNNIKLSDYGAISGELFLPKSIARGNVTLQILGDTILSNSIVFMVDDYTIAYSKSQTSINKEVFVNQDSLLASVETKLLHNDQPLINAPFISRVLITTTPYIPSGDKLKGLYFSSGKQVYQEQVHYTDGKLDEKGRANISYDLSINNLIQHGEITVSNLTQDLSGQYVPSHAKSEFFGSDRMVGIKLDNSIYSPKDKAKIFTAVSDIAGKLIAEVPIELQIDYNKGGTSKGWKKYKNLTVKSSPHDLIINEFKLDKVGVYRVTAKITDSFGRINKSTLHFYVVDGYQKSDSFNNLENNVFSSDKIEYSVGDTAHYMVNNTEKESFAQITIVKDRVIDTFSRKLPEGISIIDIEIKPEYAPGFYIYLDIMNKNSSDYLPVIKNIVKNPKHDIKIEIMTDKEVYKPGETVTLNLKSDRPANAMIMVVDAATLDFIGKNSYDLRSFFNKMLNTNRLLSYSLFGKHHDMISTRSLDYSNHAKEKNDIEVAYWNPDVALNTDATITFNNPDKAAKWVIIVNATDKGYGLGYDEHSYQSQDDLEIFVALPNNAVGGDTFNAILTLDNKFSEDINSSVITKINDGGSIGAIEPIPINIPANSKQELSIPLKTKMANASRNYNVEFALDARGRSYEARHNVTLSPSHQNLINSTYGIAEHSVNGHFKNENNNALIFKIFTPMYSKIYNFASSMRIRSGSKVNSWYELVTDLLVQATQESSQYSMGKKSHPSSPEVQNILLAAHEYQTADGMMSLYKENSPNEFDGSILTAYTAIVFSKLKDAGYIVPEDVEQKMFAYISKYVDDNPSDNIRRRVFMSHALSIQSKAIAKKISYSLRNELEQAKDLDILTHYMYILINSGEKEAAELLTKKIMLNPFQSSSSLSLSNDSGSLLHNCEAIDALAGQLKQHDLSRLARYVVNNLPSTPGPQYAVCIFNLYNYILNSEIDNDKTTYLSFNKGKNIAYNLDRDLSVADFSLKKYKDTSYLMSIDGRGYVGYAIDLIESQDNLRSENNGIFVTKKLSVVSDDLSLIPIEQPFDIKVGDIIKTEILINSLIPLSHVNISEKIPGGLIILPNYYAPYQNNGDMQINLANSYRTVDSDGYIQIKDQYLDPQYTYNLYYFSYAKVPGNFKSPATIVRVQGLDDISGQNDTSSINIKTKT